MTPQAKLKNNDVEEAVARPWAAYQTPEAVLNDDATTAAQKRRILESWERDSRELAVAEEENMGGGESNMLGRVLEALATLPAPDERQRGPATKHGSQPTPTDSPSPSEKAPRLSGEEARQGEVILRTPARKAVFIGAIVISALVAVALFYQAVP